MKKFLKKLLDIVWGLIVILFSLFLIFGWVFFTGVSDQKTNQSSSHDIDRDYCDIPGNCKGME